MKKRIFQKFYNRFLSQFNQYLMTINFTPRVLNITPEEKALCIAPHPDDETFGLGGTIAKYKDNFDIICLTNGAKGIKNVDLETIIETRKNEFQNAVQTISIKKFNNLGIEDKEVLSSYETFSKIEISDYDYIFIPNLIDTHIDHRACFSHLCKLIQSKKHKPNLKVLFYEIWGALASPNVLVDISDTISTKTKMIECYKSQLARKDYLNAILGLNQYRGLTKNIKYSEAFWMLDSGEALRLYNKFFKGADFD